VQEFTGTPSSSSLALLTRIAQSRQVAVTATVCTRGHTRAKRNSSSA